MIGRRLSRTGRPGLIGAAARTAVVAGTATAVSGRVAARQQERAAAKEATSQQGQAAAAPPPSGGALDDQALSSLERLGRLHADGLLSEEEFTAAKQRILGT
ncbi:SHOCT domain-containing protein [Streptomyces sp. cg35]|uniref:SHOCT domain-containing protein n=1 Tax=Streptomyces sp. cg35 TaxID=3421650 RepID=UPI003D180261